MYHQQYPYYSRFNGHLLVLPTKIGRICCQVGLENTGGCNSISKNTARQCVIQYQGRCSVANSGWIGACIPLPPRIVPEEGATVQDLHLQTRQQACDQLEDASK